MKNDRGIKIGIVILNYNSYTDTLDLVECLKQQTLNDSIFIVIVDNLSPNKSYDLLKPLENKHENIAVIQSGANLGYAKGNNFGLKYLDDNVKPEFVAILNNDIQLPNNSFEKLTEKYYKLDKPAIIAPKQLNANNEEILSFKVNTFLDDCLHLFYLFKIFHKRKALEYKDNSGLRAMQVEVIHGSFMFSSFEIFKEIDFFYPNTFLYTEERFIAYRVRLLGFKNYILLDENYIHAQSKTINKTYDNVSQYRLLYDGWLEYTLVCRSYGKLKSSILKPLMKLSLLEIRLFNRLKKYLKGNKNES